MPTNYVRQNPALLRRGGQANQGRLRQRAQARQALGGSLQEALANWQPVDPNLPPAWFAEAMEDYTPEPVTDYLTSEDLQAALTAWQPEATADPTTEALPAPIAGLPDFFGASEGDENWNSAYDLNADGIIDFADLAAMGDLAGTDTTPEPTPEPTVTVTAPTGSEQAYSIGQTYGLRPTQAEALKQMFDDDAFSNSGYQSHIINMFMSWGLRPLAADALYQDMQSITA